ncbi:MAG: hypothetical protein LBG22_10235 [Treponema sp.]|nr:hypothetical protein [Treponema sp.]
MKRIIPKLFLFLLAACSSPFDINMHAPQVVIVYNTIPIKLNDTLTAEIPELNSIQKSEMNIEYEWYRTDAGIETKLQDIEAIHVVSAEDIGTDIKVIAKYKYNNSISESVAVPIVQIYAGTFDEIKTALAASYKTTIIIGENIIIDESITISAGKELIITGYLIVNGDINILNGGKLTVNPNAAIDLNGSINIEANGTLENNGTINNMQIYVETFDELKSALAVSHNIEIIVGGNIAINESIAISSGKKLIITRYLIVNGDINILSGGKLTVNPNAAINLNGAINIEANGTLENNGTINNMQVYVETFDELKSALAVSHNTEIITSGIIVVDEPIAITFGKKLLVTTLMVVDDILTISDGGKLTVSTGAAVDLNGVMDTGEGSILEINGAINGKAGSVITKLPSWFTGTGKFVFSKDSRVNGLIGTGYIMDNFNNNNTIIYSRGSDGARIEITGTINIIDLLILDEYSLIVDGTIVIDPAMDILGVTSPADLYKIIVKPGASISGGTGSLNLTDGEYKWDGTAWITV